MARIVIKTAHAPKVIDPSDKPVTICMCGLSKNQPFCDGSHLKTVDEDDKKVYTYNDDGTREELGGCCGGDSSCGGDGCSCGKDK